MPTSPRAADYVRSLKPLLDRFGNEPGLTVVLYTLDETTYSRELAPLAGHYPALRLGPPWWFFDSPEGIRRFYQAVVETAGFSNTVGFNDDARSLLSIPARHDVARRLNAGYLAGLVAEHRMEEEDAAAIAEDLACNLAHRAFRVVRPRRRRHRESLTPRKEDSMLRPQDNPNRETKRLDGIWRFALDARGAGRTEGWWRATLPDPVSMPVPSSFNDVLADPKVHDHVGDVWYQRSVLVPRGWAGQRIVLRFDAATHRAAVWVADTCVAEHEGGYTPFEADVSALVEPGGDFRLTVVVNNELTWQSLPPGLVEVQPDGTRRQRQYHDFFNYAGLHRGVWLYATPHAHIADVTAVTDIDEGAGVVRYSTVVDDAAGAARVRVLLRDAEGTMVAETAGADGELRVSQPELWRPGRGYLYALEVRAGRGRRRRRPLRAAGRHPYGAGRGDALPHQR